VDHAPPNPPAYVEASPEQAIGAGYSVVDYESGFYSGATFGTVSAITDTWFRPGLQVRTGLRLAFGARVASGYGLEGLISAALSPHFGTIVDAAARTASWRPVLGVELGVTSVKLQSRLLSPQTTQHELLMRAPEDPFYGAFLVRPVRFRFTNFEATVLGFAFGTHLLNPGRELRVQIDLIEVSYVR